MFIPGPHHCKDIEGMEVCSGKGMGLGRGLGHQECLRELGEAQPGGKEAHGGPSGSSQLPDRRVQLVKLCSHRAGNRNKGRDERKWSEVAPGEVQV